MKRQNKQEHKDGRLGSDEEDDGDTGDSQMASREELATRKFELGSIFSR